MACDDGLACTRDACTAGACSNTLKAGSCLGSGGACVANAEPDPAAPCTVCSAADGTWTTLADGATCDDGDGCTVGDLCELGACKPGTPLVCKDTACVTGAACVDGGCVGTETACDDGDPCTDDGCDPVAGCAHAPRCGDGDPCTTDTCDSADGTCATPPMAEGAACDDGDACAVGETCLGGVCGGGVAPNCDDGNPCTADSCLPLLGCANVFAELACDDGIACTTGDLCSASVCIGVKGECPACDPPVTPLAAKVIALALGTDGNPGSGLDIDDNPATCEPEGDCSAGIDNALALLEALVNDSLLSSLADGSLIYVMDLSAMTTDGSPFDVSVYDSNPSTPAGPCAWQSAECDFVAGQLSFDGDCSPYFVIDNAVLDGAHLTAGSASTVITMALPLGTAVLPINIARGRVDAQLVMSADGTNVEGLQGILGGAVVKAQLIAAVDAIDAAALPLDKSFVKAMLEDIIRADIDLDGDGVKESASIGLAVKAIAANLVAQ
jgi:hypothetical protein